MAVATEVAELFNKQETPRRPQDPYSGLRKELAGYVEELQKLRYRDTDEAMAWLSSVSARALYMMSLTLQSDTRAATKFRVEELIPFRDETRFQFQIASRRQAIAEHEWSIVRGQET